jgi:site-specific recombinase XerD
MTRRDDNLLVQVERYFQDHLRRVRGASEHTIRAYGDALRLFFLFLADHVHRPVARLRLDDIRADAVLAFLVHVESKRGNAAVTRNCRLAALRSFADHLLRHDVTRAEQYGRILAIAPKRARQRVISYLEPVEVRAVLTQIDVTTAAGARDRALLLFLYNTGARVAEALAVRPRDLQLERPRAVRVHGKGNRERTCPIWAETATALRPLVDDADSPDAPIFRNARRGPLTRDGAAYLIAKHARRAADSMPSLRRRRVTPHVLRHSCAVALLQAGVDVTVIRDYLGHASIATTSRYLATNLQMKRDVLAAFWKRAGLDRQTGRWRPSPSVISFLASL